MARTLWNTTSKSKLPAKRLTQQHKREAKGKSPIPPAVPPPRRENLCRGCGKVIRDGRVHCAECEIPNATERLIGVARTGRALAHTPEARAREAEKQRRHADARSAWRLTGQLAPLTPEMYSDKVQPLLASLSISAIARAIGVSRWYAGRIRRGYRPHPRHWLALAKLVGVWMGIVHSAKRAAGFTERPRPS